MKDKIRSRKPLAGKKPRCPSDAFSRHPRAARRGPTRGRRLEPGARRLGAFSKRGRFARGGRARGRVAARSGFRVRPRDGRARTRERRLHRHLGGRLGGEERAASGDGALARRGATHARGGDTAASARHREAGHGHAERGGHRRRPVRMEWPACARSGPKPQNPACEMRRDVSKPNRGRYQPAGRVFFFFWRRAPSHVRSFSLFSFASKNSPIPPLSRKIRVRPRVQWETVSIARREAFVCSRWRSRK